MSCETCSKSIEISGKDCGHHFVMDGVKYYDTPSEIASSRVGCMFYEEKAADPMRVYQVIRCTGQWEDYHERVIGTYLDLAKAETEKANQIRQIEGHVKEYDECRGCCNDRPCFAPDADGECCHETWFDDELYDASVVIRSFDVIE